MPSQIFSWHSFNNSSLCTHIAFRPPNLIHNIKTQNLTWSSIIPPNLNGALSSMHKTYTIKLIKNEEMYIKVSSVMCNETMLTMIQSLAIKFSCLPTLRFLFICSISWFKPQWYIIDLAKINMNINAFQKYLKNQVIIQTIKNPKPTTSTVIP